MINKNRFEFCLDYNEAKTFPYRKMQYSPKYSAVLVGAMPHSVKDKGDFSSMITAMEKQDGYPPVIRMGSNELKITKTGFCNCLKNLLEQKGIEKGIQLGRQEGRSEGEREATLKIARTMLQNGIDRNTVMKMTGLTEDDLAQIRH